MNKKKIIILFSFIVLVLVMAFLLFKKNIFNTEKQNQINPIFEEKNLILNNNSTYSIELDLLEKFNDINIGTYDFTILDTYENLILGELNDTREDDITFVTKSLIVYDATSEKISKYDYNESKRIWKYSILNNYIFYVSAKYNQKEDTFFWEIVRSNLDFSNKKVLRSGKVVNAIFLPIVKKINDEHLVFAFIQEDMASFNHTKSYEIFSISSNDSEEIIEKGTNNSSLNNGPVLSNMDMIKSDDNTIQYVIYFNKNQEVISYDLTRKEKTTLYNYANDGTGLYEFIQLGNGYYYNMNHNTDDDVGNSFYVKDNVSYKTNLIQYKQTLKYTADELLIKQNNDYYLLNLTSKMLDKIKFESNLYFYPYIYKLKDERIVMMSNPFNIYLGKIVKK